MMSSVKDARGLSKSTNVLDSLLLSCHGHLKLMLVIWSTHFPVSILLTFNSSASAMKLQSQPKIKVVFKEMCYSLSRKQSPTVLEFLQLQVTWAFMRKNRLVMWRQRLPFDRCRWCCLWRMQEACRRAQTYWKVYFYHVIAISSYCWSFEVLTFP